MSTEFKFRQTRLSESLISIFDTKAHPKGTEFWTCVICVLRSEQHNVAAAVHVQHPSSSARRLATRAAPLDGQGPSGPPPAAALLSAHRGATRVHVRARRLPGRVHPKAVARVGGRARQLGQPLGVPALVRRPLCRHRQRLALSISRLSEWRWWVPISQFLNVSLIYLLILVLFIFIAIQLKK